MNRRIYLICGLSLAAFTLLFMQGCATIISGTTQEVSFTSIPEGVTVSADGKVLGITPLTIQIDRKGKQKLIFEKEGYKTLELPFETTLEPWFWGNILIGGVIGSTTDAISGAVYEYSPGQYNVTLEPIEGFQPADSEKNDVKGFIISNYNNILPELHAGQGEYLSSMMTLLKIPKEEQAEAIAQIKALAEKNKDIPTFANEVVNAYLK